MKLKYVRHSKYGVILFPAETELFHRHIQRATESARIDALDTKEEARIISAGFVEITSFKDTVPLVVVSGRPESAYFAPLPDDAAAIEKQLFK